MITTQCRVLTYGRLLIESHISCFSELSRIIDRLGRIGGIGRDIAIREYRLGYLGMACRSLEMRIPCREGYDIGGGGNIRVSYAEHSVYTATIS